MSVPSARRVRLVLAAAVLIPAFGLAACSADQSDLQNKIKSALNGNLNPDAKSSGLASADSVSCPSNVQLKSGYRFDCTVTGTDTDGKSGQTFTFHGVIQNTNHVAFISLERTGAATPTPSTPATTTT